MPTSKRRRLPSVLDSCERWWYAHRQLFLHAISNLVDSMPSLNDLPSNTYAHVCRLLEAEDLANLEKSSRTLRHQTRDHGWQTEHYQHPHAILHRPLDRFMPAPQAWKALVRERHLALRHPPEFSSGQHTLWVASLGPGPVSLRRDGEDVVRQRAERLVQAGYPEAADKLMPLLQAQQTLKAACGAGDVAAAAAAIAAGASTTTEMFTAACRGGAYALVKVLCAGIELPQRWQLGSPARPNNAVTLYRQVVVPLSFLREPFFYSLCRLIVHWRTPNAEVTACLAAARRHGLPSASAAACYEQAIMWQQTGAFKEAAMTDPAGIDQFGTVRSLTSRLAAIAAVVVLPDAGGPVQRLLAAAAGELCELCPGWRPVSAGAWFNLYGAGDFTQLIDILLKAGWSVNSPVDGQRNALEHLLHRYGHKNFLHVPGHAGQSQQDVGNCQVGQLVDLLICRGSRRVDLALIPNLAADKRAYVLAQQAKNM